MIINNQDKNFIEEIEKSINDNTSIRICVNSFTFNALFDLIED